MEMDYERYYDKRSNGKYIVHFANNAGLSEDKVINTFSRFGKVVNVNNRGQSHGLCFVTYETLRDVKSCIDGFQNDKFIKILPHINKAKTGVTKKGAYTSNKKCQKEKFENQIQPKKKSPNSSISSKCSNSKITSRNLYAEEEILDNRSIPPLMSVNLKGTRRASSQYNKFIPAEEVIVANIHPSLSIHYILHLFEKYNPIAISKMMTTVKTGISYCHVYYETSEEANATTKEFDMFCLLGKNLIVLTSQQLMEEAL